MYWLGCCHAWSCIAVGLFPTFFRNNNYGQYDNYMTLYCIHFVLGVRHGEASIVGWLLDSLPESEGGRERVSEGKENFAMRDFASNFSTSARAQRRQECIDLNTFCMASVQALASSLAHQIAALSQPVGMMVSRSSVLSRSNEFSYTFIGLLRRPVVFELELLLFPAKTSAYGWQSKVLVALSNLRLVSESLTFAIQVPLRRRYSCQ